MTVAPKILNLVAETRRRDFLDQNQTQIANDMRGLLLKKE